MSPAAGDIHLTALLIEPAETDRPAIGWLSGNSSTSGLSALYAAALGILVAFGFPPPVVD
jgi:hypothetical protein